MMAGKIPAFFLPVPGQSTKEVAAGSALSGHAGMALWVFSYVAAVSCAGGAAEYVNKGQRRFANRASRRCGGCLPVVDGAESQPDPAGCAG